MLSLFCGIFLIVVIVCVFFAIKGFSKIRTQGVGIAATVVGALSLLCFIGLIIPILCYITDISTAHTIDSKIQMIEEENAKIEEKINVAVQNYLEHEQNTLTNLKPENAMAVLAAYPELRSDTLVEAQVNKYIANTKELKELKEQKIDIAKAKWLVYFGK